MTHRSDLRSRESLRLFAAGLALLLAACDDSTSPIPTDDAEDSTDAMEDAGDLIVDTPEELQVSDPDQEEEEPIASPDRLVVITPADGSSLQLAYNSQGTVLVEYRSADDTLIAGAGLAFEIVSSTGDCHTLPTDPGVRACMALGAATATTGEDGQASVEVLSGGSDTNAVVRVSRQDQPSVDPVDIDIQVRAADSYDFTVRFTYGGNRQFTSVTPMLFNKSNVSACVNLFTPPLRDPDVLPTPTRELPAVTRDPGDGSIPDVVFTSLPNGSAYLVLGYAESGEMYPGVYGCQDAGSTPDEVVVVELEEVPTSISGIYALSSNFELLSGLPAQSLPSDPLEAGDWVETIVDLFEEPSQTLVDLIWPSIQAEFGDDLPAGLEPIFQEMIEGAIGYQAPNWIGNAATIGQDVREFASNMQLVGELVLINEPDLSTGSLSAGNTHRYNGVSLRWRLPCVLGGSTPTECETSRAGISFAQLGRTDLATHADWSGAVEPCDDGDSCLVIAAHDMTLAYGQIFLSVIEGWILPALYGVLFDELETFPGAALWHHIRDWYNSTRPVGEQVADTSCQAVGIILARLAYGEIVGDPVLIEAVGEFACSEARVDLLELIDQQNGGLVEQVTAELASQGDCPLGASDDYTQVLRIGEADDRCNWSVQLTWGDLSPTQQTGRFHAQRGGF